MGSSRPRNSTRAATAHSVNSPPKPRRRPAQSPEPAKRKESALHEGIKSFLAADRLSRDALHERPKPTQLRTDADFLRDVERTRGTKAAQQLSVSPTQVLREMTTTTLQGVQAGLETVSALIAVCADVLDARMVDSERDVAIVLQRCALDTLARQRERIESLLKEGASS